MHAFVYEPSVGIAKRLEVDFRQYFDELRDVYDLYRAQAPAPATDGTKRAKPPMVELWTNVSDSLMDCSEEELDQLLSKVDDSADESAELFVDMDRKKTHENIKNGSDGSRSQ